MTAYHIWFTLRKIIYITLEFLRLLNINKIVWPYNTTIHNTPSVFFHLTHLFWAQIKEYNLKKIQYVVSTYYNESRLIRDKDGIRDKCSVCWLKKKNRSNQKKYAKMENISNERNRWNTIFDPQTYSWYHEQFFDHFFITKDLAK